MKPTILSPILAALLMLGFAAPAAAQSTATRTWPPAHMKHLPADYIAHLHKALQTCADRIEDLQADDKEVLWLRAGIGGFALGREVDKLNDYFASDSFEFVGNPKFGFSLFSSSLIRAYAVFNHRTGTMKGLLSRKAEKRFEQQMWLCAKANSKLTEAQRDVWDMEGSENHHMTSKVSDFLVAQFLMNTPEYAGQTYDDGSSPRQQYEARLAYWNKWIDAHARRGLFIEDGGSSYENYTIEALFNLRDFTQDPVLHKKADMFLDLVFANMAEETLRTQRSGPKTRTKEESFRSQTYALLFGSPGEAAGQSMTEGGAFEEADKRELHSIEASYMLPTSDYYPSPAIVSLARDIRTREVYSFIKRSPGSVVPGTTENKTIPVPIMRSKWRRMDKDNTMLRYGFASSHYMMGSHGLDTSAKADPYLAQRWQGIVFANDPMACIGMDGKGGVTKGGYISNPFKTIQDRNIMATRKWAPAGSPRNVDPCLWIYFSCRLDSVEEDGGWIFVRSGGAFAAVKAVEGGYEWQRPWQHRATFHPGEKSFIRLNSENSPILMIANDGADYGNDFAAFKTALKAQPIAWAGGVLQFASITHEGLSSPGKVNGENVNLRPARVNDSPFIRSEWDSGVVYIRKGDEALILDFSDPNNPQKTLGIKPDERFPAGAGHALPVVFAR